MSCYAKYFKKAFKRVLVIRKQFKDTRKKVINSIKKLKVKRKYFAEKLEASKSDPRKTWPLIDELKSRQCKLIKVSQLKSRHLSLSFSQRHIRGVSRLSY